MTRGKRALVRFLKLAVAGALLYWIFQVVPLAGVSRALGSARLAEVLVGLLLLVGSRIIAAFRMKLLTERQGLSFSPVELFEISTTATLYGLVLPGIVSGGLVRWYRLARRGEPVRALASLTWDRLADATWVAGIGTAAWLFSRPAPPHAAVGPLLIALFAALLLLYLAGFSRHPGERMLRLLESAVARLRWPRAQRVIQAAAEAARRYHDAARGFRYAVAALSLLSQLVGAAALVLWARSLGIQAGVAELTWVRSTQLLVALLPITFAGLGAREGIFIVLLGPYGVSGTAAVALSLLQFGGTLAMAGVGGLFELRALWRMPRPPRQS